MHKKYVQSLLDYWAQKTVQRSLILLQLIPAFLEHLSREGDFSVALHRILKHQELIILSLRSLGLKSNHRSFVQPVRAALSHLLAFTECTVTPFHFNIDNMTQYLWE